MPYATLDRIAAAKDLQELDSMRVALLGKSGGSEQAACTSTDDQDVIVRHEDLLTSF